jgi:hypothetical protein
MFDQSTGDLVNTSVAQAARTGRSCAVVRPPRIELGLRVPETLVISLSLRARGSFLTLGFRSVNVRVENGRWRMEDRLLGSVRV